MTPVTDPLTVERATRHRSGMDRDDVVPGRVASGLTAAAFVWAVLLLLRAATHDGYVADYGAAILLLHAIPAALVGIGWLALRGVCTHGSRASLTVAWLATLVLAVWSVLAGFSVGFLSQYSALLLLGAVVLTPVAARATGARCGQPG